MTDVPYHIPALLAESIEGLNIRPDGVYVDVTFGGGGHSRAILSKLSKKGKLIAFDQDADAQQNSMNDARFTLVQHNFIYLTNFLEFLKIKQIDGLIADLGISSHQIDIPERGFSFRYDAPLDMRMNTSAKLTAASIINDYSAEDLKRILTMYGEVENAGSLAHFIVKARMRQRITTTGQMVDIMNEMYHGKVVNKMLARVFQAFRIEVNQEMEVLKKLLIHTEQRMNKGGRLVVISYHSLEDRLVKNFIRSGNFEGTLVKDIYGNVSTQWDAVNKKPIVPVEDETDENNRARSAKLRIAEKK